MMVAIWAALAMCAQDLMGVLLVQAEARNRAVLAAALDSVMWLATITTTSISVTALQGHQIGLKAEIICWVTIANAAATYVAVRIGKRFIRADVTPVCPCPNCAVTR